jgi:hypothetical protein
MAGDDSFKLTWKKSEEYCSSYETEFSFYNKAVSLRISMVTNYVANIALKIGEEGELQTPSLIVGDEDSDVGDSVIKLQSAAEEALSKCFKTGNISLIGLIKNMGYSIPESKIFKV